MRKSVDIFKEKQHFLALHPSVAQFLPIACRTLFMRFDVRASVGK